jgi:hypothetical protein
LSRWSQVELTTGGDYGAPDPHPESLLVLYLDNQADRDVIVARLPQTEVIPANPYWRAHARAYADPTDFSCCSYSARRSPRPT